MATINIKTLDGLLEIFGSYQNIVYVYSKQKIHK
jgi:hypothetical protein